MAGPWESYQSTDAGADSGKPWESYRAAGAKPKVTEAPPIIGSAPRKPPAEFNRFAESVGGLVEPMLSMLTAPVGTLAGAAGGFGGMGKEMMSGGGMPGDPSGFKNELQRKFTYEPKTKSGQAVNEYNPIALFAKLFEHLGEGTKNLAAPPATSGPIQSVLGDVAGETVKAAPALVGGMLPKAAPAVSGALKDSATSWMNSAVKPTLKARQTGKADPGIETLLDEGINVTKGGAEKLRGKVDDLNTRIATLIQNSPAAVSKPRVGSYLHSTFEKFRNQVNATDDLATIQKAWEDFRDHPLLPGLDIPVQTAQKMKQGTYRALGDKSYGELKGAAIESQKALARGLKEEIANAVPEVRTLNAQESKLLNALSMVERRIMVSANKNPMGLSWLASSPMKMLGFMADRSELFKSLIARMLNQGSQMAPGAMNMAPIGGMGTFQPPAAPQ